MEATKSRLAQETGCKQRRDRTSVDSQTPLAWDTGAKAFGNMIWKAIVLLVAILSLAGNAARATTYYVPRFGAPVLIGDRIIFAEPGQQPHRLICIRKQDGRKMWELNDPKQKLQPWFVLGNRLIITAGSAIQSCDPGSGRIVSLYRTTYADNAILVKSQPDGSVLVLGEKDDVDYLRRVDSRSWQMVWEAPRILWIQAEGQSVLLCRQATRMTLGGGRYSLLDERWVALSKADGKLLWSCPPFANATVINNYFLIYQNDTISCLDQRDGRTVKQFRIQPQHYALVSFATKNLNLLVRIDPGEFDTNNRPKYVFFSLSVPNLQSSKLTEIDWKTAMEAEAVVRDDDYAYAASIAPNGNTTSIIRNEIKTGKRETLYQEAVPPALRSHPVPRPWLK